MRYLKASCAVLLACAVIWVAAAQLADGGSEGELPAADPPQLQVVAYPSGLTGFFDPTTSQLHVYGADLKTPFMSVQVEKLGEPLKVMKEPPQ